MSAVLRASGPDFDVDAFVADCSWNVDNVFRRGDAVLRTKTNGRKRGMSGLNVVVSEADFDQFAQQLEDAVEFFTEAAEEIRRLVAFPGVTTVVLDFGIAWLDVAAQSDWIPADVVRLAGASGIALAVSHYPVNDGEAAAG